ncbi:MAG: hypothetical protein LBK67_11360 [Coriobacteriales bacterium]|jgi:hypothetical protein|nr:hypothetical protein [Coriobacteriales bacterium]
MAKRLRKMLGSRDASCTQSLLNLIETQDKMTICTWCIDYAKAHFLPIFERRCPGDDRLRKALEAARDYLSDRAKFSEVKSIIWYGTASEADSDPIVQAAERAVGQAASYARHPSRWHAIAVYFYGAAAVAYDQLGLHASDEEYNAVAEAICADMTARLQQIAYPVPQQR